MYSHLKVYEKVYLISVKKSSAYASWFYVKMLNIDYENVVCGNP